MHPELFPVQVGFKTDGQDHPTPAPHPELFPDQVGFKTSPHVTPPDSTSKYSRFGSVSKRVATMRLSIPPELFPVQVGFKTEWQRHDWNDELPDLLPDQVGFKTTAQGRGAASWLP